MAAEKVCLSIAAKIIELLFEPIQRELGYLLCFNNNIRDLQTGLRELEATRNDVQGREDAEQRSRKTLGEAVKLWIVDANGKITEAEKVIEDKTELQKGCFSIKWCPNLKLRFSLGRKGKKLSLVLKELLQSGKDHLLLTGIDLPMLPINMSNYTGDASDFESRKKIMEEIIEMLMEKETRLIGICGMPGIGKTTFAKQVLQKVHDFHNNLFKFQVISTLSRPPNFNAIQQQVVEMLGGPSLKEIENDIVRAEHFRRAFDNKKVVVLLDDVWEEFDLNAKGFPLKESDCCKIIYTSRNKDLWLGEGTITRKEISLKDLSSEEAWNLFKRKVDPRDGDNDYRPNYEIGRKIVDECKGLPLALEVVGSALYKKETYHWEDMLSQMKNHHDQPSKIKAALKTSYDFLEEDNEKSLFLICCLFQEDSLIPIETLYRYAMGLQLFKGTMNDLYHIRNRVYTLVDDLVRRNLLIHAQDNRTLGRVVKMHDVVRDVGLSIAKQEEKDIHFLICGRVNQNYVGPNTKMISILVLKSGLKVPDDVMEFRGSKLELLRLENNSSLRSGSDTEISWNLFQGGADDLKVLDIFGPHVISEFPYSSLFPYLAKLKMLSLEYMDLKITSNVSFIKHLTSLETLSFRWSVMKALSNEVGELRNLKVLDLTHCPCFIKDGILSRLTNLQELYMWGSFEDWKTLKEEDILSIIREDNNNAAKLSELNFLDKLRRLELIVPNIEQVPRNVRLFSSSTLLKQFKISIAAGRACQLKPESGERHYLMVKNVEDSINLFYALGALIENDFTGLYLHGDSNNMWEKMFLNRHLSATKDIVLGHCESIITLFVPSESSQQISCIEETNGFGHLLRRIKIYECSQMRHLCSTSIFRHLKKLKVLVLKKCERMEEVVSICNNKEELEKIELNTLETLKLCQLNQLTCFCKGINEICFDRLRSLKLEGLESFIFPNKIEIPQLKYLKIISIPSIITLCNILAPSLQELKIDDCDNLKYICFSNSLMVNTILHLQYLTITECKRLKGVICTEEQRHISIKFSNLMKLELGCLDKLVSFVIHNNNLGVEEENEDKPQNALFYCDEDEVSFPCLRELRLHELSKINYIIGWKDRQCHHRDIEEGCDKEILQPFFPNLKSLTLGYFCQLVSFVGFINSMGDNSEKQNTLFYQDDDEVSFSCLEELRIEHLSKIKYIVARKGQGGRRHHRNIEEDCDEKIQPQFFPNLSKLGLFGLYQLVSFVAVKNNIDDESEKQNALFYEDDEVSFSCLEKLRIEHLSKIKYIVARKGQGGRRHHRTIEEDCDEKIQPQFFPNLSNLRLFSLYQLVSFVAVKSEKQNALFYEDDKVSFPYLKSLEIEGLPKINYLVGYKGKEEDNDIIKEKDDYDNKLHPPMFPMLRDLLVYDLSNLIHMYKSNHPEGGVILFQNVRKLEIINCWKLRYLFSENIIGRVSAKDLYYIRIRNCPTMEVVMKNEEELGGEDDKAKREGTICHYFPLLQTLELRDLLGLRRFCDVAYPWTLPSLKKVEVSKCPKLEALSPGYLDSPRLKSFEYDDSEELIAENWKGDVNAALRDKKKDQNPEWMFEDEDEYKYD